MSKPAAAALLAVAAASVGCLDEHEYVEAFAEFGVGWGAGAAALRGDVGQIRGIDNLGQDISYQSGPTWVRFSGDVPHQSRRTSSVYIAVEVQNAHRLPIGGELSQTGTGDLYSDDTDGTPQLSVYICPNGEGVSGNADEIVVKRIGRASFTFVASSTVPEQNLAVDLGVGSDAESGLIEDEMMQPRGDATVVE